MCMTQDAWEHAGKKQDKKKKVQPVGKQNGNDSVFQGSQRERDNDREDRKPSERREKRDRSDGPPRPRRDRAPRFQRGASSSDLTLTCYQRFCWLKGIL